MISPKTSFSRQPVAVPLAPARALFFVTEETSADVFAREKLLDEALRPGASSENLRATANGASACARARACREGRRSPHRDHAHVGHSRRHGPAGVAARPARRCARLSLAWRRRRDASRKVCGGLRRAIIAPCYSSATSPIMRASASREPSRKNLAMPGPVERDRFLGLELVPGALADAQGRVMAAGERIAHAVAPTALPRAA